MDAARFFVYSVLRATTGSFLAARREGIAPARIVSTMLITTRMAAAPPGRIAAALICVRW